MSFTGSSERDSSGPSILTFATRQNANVRIEPRPVTSTNRCHAALTPDYTPSPAKWLRPKRSEIGAALNTAASFSPAAVSRLRRPTPNQGLGDGIADASRTGYQGCLLRG